MSFKDIFSWKSMLSGCIKYLKTANIYIKKDDDTIEIQQNQLFATRLFSIFFLMSLIGLVGYAGLTLRLSNVQVKNPSQSTFEKLYADYSKTLSCSCSQTSIQINKFVNFTISYHQVNKYSFSLHIKFYLDLHEYLRNR